MFFRAAFIACKRSGCCTALIWAFAANLEWRMNRCQDVARRLFEVGMRQFSHDIDFVLEYSRMFILNLIVFFLILFQVRAVFGFYWL